MTKLVLTKESMDSMVRRQSWKDVNNEKVSHALATEAAQEFYGKLTKTERDRESMLRFFFFACGSNRPTYSEIYTVRLLN
jgi:hypothetical protein